MSNATLHNNVLIAESDHSNNNLSLNRSLKNNNTSGEVVVQKCADVVSNDGARPISESPDPMPMMDSVVEARTLVPSFLHHMGLQQYATSFMQWNIQTCGQLVLTPTKVLCEIVPCDNDRNGILYALRDVYVSLLSANTAQQYYSNPATTPQPLRSTDASVSLTAPLPSSTSPSIQSTTTTSTARILSQRCNDPYAFSCICPEDSHDYIAPYAGTDVDNTTITLKQSGYPTNTTAAAAMPTYDTEALSARRTHVADVSVTTQVPTSCEAVMPPYEAGKILCICVVHFKHRQSEYTSPFLAIVGQYVMVSGDRGEDLGLVVRVNTDMIDNSYAERMGTILRLAYQKEVDYATHTLRAEEMSAMETCRIRAQRFGLNMCVNHAEYQYDKRKLTFYYDSPSRVDFVSLLKDLYREFGCRIWMEKLPRNTNNAQPLEL